jgi:hypothetical protein
MTSFGSMDDAYGGITVSESSVEVRSKTTHEDGQSLVSTSMPWKPRSSWFVFAENERRVWMFDGGTKLLMHQQTRISEVSSSGTWYTASNLPCELPNQVLNRLPDAVLQKVKLTL